MRALIDDLRALGLRFAERGPGALGGAAQRQDAGAHRHAARLVARAGDRADHGRRRARHHSVSKKTDYLVAGESAGLQAAEGRAPGRGGARRGRAARAARSVTGERDRHVVLDHVRESRGDAVVEEREREQMAVDGLAVADEVGVAGERAGLALAAPAAAVPRMRLRACRSGRRRPCCCAGSCRLGVRRSLGEQVDDFVGGRAVASDSPEPSTTRGCMPSSSVIVWLTTAAPAAVVPAPPAAAPRSLSSVSAKKLSDGGSIRRDQLGDRSAS